MSTSQKPKGNKSFVKRVMDLLQGGDESKISRFHKRIVKSWKEQIRIREDEAERLQEKIEDKKEELTEAVFNVDVEKIQTVDDTEKYIVTYSSKINGLQKDIAKYEEEIEEKNSEIADFQDLIDLVA